MKIGKLTLIAAATAVVLSSCTRKDTLSYICRCTGNSMGPVETYRITETSDKKLRNNAKATHRYPWPIARYVNWNYTNTQLILLILHD